jgi:hypothetical protein
MGKLIGILIIILSVMAGVAFWLYSFINWALFPIIEAATTTPLDGEMLGWGIAWIFLSKVVAAFIIWGGFIIGGIVMAVSAGISD